MAIKLVVLDADKTLWSHPDVSSLTLPFKLVNENVISDANGETFHLFGGTHEMLGKLQKRKIIITLASWNKPEPVNDALRLFGIDKFFKIVKAELHPDKHLMIENTLLELSEEGIKLEPDEILYVDDRTIHLEQVRSRIGAIHFIQMGVDVKTPKEVLEHAGRA